MFDEETEELADELGLEVAFPPAELRHRMDSKIETTRLGNEAGVPSVPNVMGRRTAYADLLALARVAGLGDDLVVQTPYGDSGQTTFFIADEDDWKASESKIVGQDIKVMKRIEPRELAIEGVITRHGTLVGPLMTELTGFPELTPVRRRLVRQRRVARRAHRGAAHDSRASARRRWASACARRATAGYFELDFLLDADDGRDLAGRAEPAGDRGEQHHERDGRGLRRHAAVPLPSAGVHGRRLRDRRGRAERTVGAPGQRRRVDAVHPEADRRCRGAHHRGALVGDLADGARSHRSAYARRDTDWHTVADEAEAFYLRIASTGGSATPAPTSASW